MPASLTPAPPRAREFLISPASFREMAQAAQDRVLEGLARRGLDHAMYVLVDGDGEVARVVTCCTVARPCRPEAFRIRPGMHAPVLPVRAHNGHEAGVGGTRFFALANEPESIPQARRLVDETLHEWGHDPSGAVGLVLSELVTNAIVHARLRGVSVTLADERLRMEVLDDNHTAPVLRPADGLNGGYGLNLVNELSERWGWELDGDGKRVWCDLAAPGR